MSEDQGQPSQPTPSEELVDVASRGTATQSSISPWSLASGAQAAVSGDFTRDFTIHTSPDDTAPWWHLDLNAWYPVELIVLRNRKDARFWSRSESVRIESSENGEDWTLLHAGYSIFGAQDHDALTLPLAGRLPIRFLRISLDKPQQLHLTRVEVRVPAKVVADRDLMESIGISFDGLTRFSTGEINPETYHVLRDTSEIASPPTGIRLARSGRFANNVYQLAHAFRIADRYALDFVQTLELSCFDFARTVERDGPRAIPAGATLPTGSVAVEGDFYFTQRISRALGHKGLHSQATTRAVRKYLTPYLSLPDLVSSPTDDELVIHVRSGDLFGARPHPGYGQPPLSFYVWSIDQAKEHGFHRVRVIAEDRRNPVVNGLDQHLTASNVPHTMQVGNDLDTDIATLIASRGVVFGVGTFGHAICMLSPHVRVVFEASKNSAYSSGFPHLDVYSVAPAKNDYGPFLNWKRSDEQVAEMLSYPFDSMKVNFAPASTEWQDETPGTLSKPSPGEAIRNSTVYVDDPPRSVPSEPGRAVSPRPTEVSQRPADTQANHILLLLEEGSHRRVDHIEGLTVDFRGTGSMIEIGEGSVFANAKIVIGSGSRVSIGKTHARGLRNVTIDMGGQGRNKLLTIGEGTSIESARLAMVNESDIEIHIGKDCLMSSNLTFRGTDGHTIIDRETGKVVNRTRPIVIGNNVWVGASVTFIKGCKVADNTVVATQAVVSRRFDEEFVAIAGNPAQVVKRGVAWDRSYLTNYVEQ